MEYGYDYPELYNEDKKIQLCVSELRKLRRAVRKARQNFSEAMRAIGRLEGVLRALPASENNGLLHT